MRMIVTRPQHDVTTRYLSAWAQEIIERARQKGFEVVDLIKEKSTRSEFEGRMKKLAPELVFLNGHGSDDCVCGQDNEILLQKGENHNLLSRAITYALSCDSARGLGPAAVEGRTGSYIGYTDEFIFMADAQYMREPLEDPKARPFMESSNQVMHSLLKGHTPEQASQRSKGVFRKKFTHLSSSVTDPDALQAAQFLWWNMRHQVCL